MESDINYIKNHKPDFANLIVNFGKYTTLKNFN